jgi:Sugar (and other) transporter
MVGAVFLWRWPESPRYLVSVGRFDEARASLARIAMMNGVDFDVPLKFVFVEEKGEGNQYLSIVAKKEENSSSQMRELCKNPRYASNLFYSGVIWCALIINYYIVAFYLKYFPGDIYANTFFMAVADILAYAISAVFVKRMGLTLSVIISLSTAGFGALLYLFYFHQVALIPLFIVLCRVGNSMLLNIMYLTNQTLFPTQYQSSSFGLLNFISHVSAVAAPIIAEMSDPYPFFLYVVNCVLAILSSFFLR